MCPIKISGCGKGYVPPEKQANEVIRVEVPEAAAQAEAKPSIGDRIKMAVEKIGSIDPDKFKDIFADPQVSHAKAEINEMVHTSPHDRGRLADLVKDFEHTTSKMDNGQLLEVAQHLNELMRKTNGNDDLLGSLLGSVLDKMDKPARGEHNMPPGHIWDEKLPGSERRFPWDEKLPQLKPFPLDHINDINDPLPMKMRHKNTLNIDSDIAKI